MGDTGRTVTNGPGEQRDFALAKQRIRAEVRALRDSRAALLATDPASGIALRDAVTARLAGFVANHGARRVCCFVPVRGEPDTTGFIAWALDEGIEVLLPKTLADGKLAWLHYRGGELNVGGFGIPEPLASAGEASAQGAPFGAADLVFVPAAAIDRSGMRLGWGRGFYDRELARLGDESPVVCAVVFENEVFDTLPSEPHDIPVTWACTEERVHRFG